MNNKETNELILALLDIQKIISCEAIKAYALRENCSYGDASAYLLGRVDSSLANLISDLHFGRSLSRKDFNFK